MVRQESRFDSWEKRIYDNEKKKRVLKKYWRKKDLEKKETREKSNKHDTRIKKYIQVPEESWSHTLAIRTVTEDGGE